MEEIFGPVGVACCQVVLQIGSVDENRARAEVAVREAAAVGARIIVLPELANTGYVFADAAEAFAVAEPLAGPTVEHWRQLSRELDIVLVAGFAERDDDGVLYNSAALVDAGDLKAVYRKAHLWNSEKKIFTPGRGQPPVADTRWGRIGLMVCYDLEFPEWVRAVAFAGADLLAAPVNWPSYPRPDGERPSEIVRVQADAAVNRMAIAVCDRAGAERGQGWVGGSVIVDADGFPLSPITLGVPGTIHARLDLRTSRDKAVSERNDVHGDRRPELYTAVAAPVGSQREHLGN